MPQPSASAIESIKDNVKDYYGKVLSSTVDIKSNVCTLSKRKMPKHVQEALALVHDEVTSKYYGCGMIIPDGLEGMDILDLGCGAGQDCYILSKLVGKDGSVTGLDMTDEQLGTARAYIDYHTKKYNYPKPNISFVQGYMENLADAGCQDNSFDIIVSNCTVNLSPDKKAVLEEAYRVLKVGGEMYFSDIYADSDLPDELRSHKVLWGEGVAGALLWKDLNRLASQIGFAEPLLVASNTFSLCNPELEALCGDTKFVSATCRLFKLPKEPHPPCQVVYRGSVTNCEEEVKLDHKIKFKTEETVNVDSEIATILQSSRLAKEFTFQQNTDQTHATVTIETMDPFVLASH